MARILQTHTSKEAHHVHTRPPPRRAGVPEQSPILLPLEQLWMRMPPVRRLELTGQLSRILAARLAARDRKEPANE